MEILNFALKKGKVLKELCIGTQPILSGIVSLIARCPISTLFFCSESHPILILLVSVLGRVSIQHSIVQCRD